LQLSGPMMSGSAGLHSNQASRLLCEECQQPSSHDTTLNDNRSLTINAMNLKDRLAEIQTHRNCCFHSSPPIISQQQAGWLGESRPQHQLRTSSDVDLSIVI